MKVLVATTAIAAGGAARHLLDLALEVSRAGVEVTVGHDLRASWLDACRSRGLATTPLDRIGDYDILHLHLADTYDKAALRLLLTSRMRHPRSRRVVTEHLPRNNSSDPSLDRNARTPGAYAGKTAFKLVQYSLCDAVIAVSAGSAGFIRQRYKNPKIPIFVVENGIEATAEGAPRRGPVSDRRRVWAIGDLSQQKGWDVLIGAASASKAEWIVDVMGDGAQRNALEREADRLAAGRFTFHGRRSDIDLLLREGGITCCPSRWESSSYVALEGMRAGLPVVATRVDGLEDIVSDGVTGLLVTPGDPHALATALDRLAFDPVLAAKLGEAGRMRQQGRFSLQRMVGQTLNVYAEVL